MKAIMMLQPDSHNAPYTMDAKAEKTYAWCACGLSKKQPLCDGSHTGTGKTPTLFSVDEEKTLVLCGCKQTKKPPYCDGTHLTL